MIKEIGEMRAVETEDGFWEVWCGDRRVTDLTFVDKTMAEGWIKQRKEIEA